MKATHAAILAALAAFPAGQIAQQQGILKFAGDVTIREPLAINHLPPLSFALAPLDLVQITDASGPYTVPAGKRLLVREFWLQLGSNLDHPSFESPSTQVWIGTKAGVGVIYDPTGEYDALSYAMKTTLQPFEGGSGSGTYVETTQFTFFEAGTILQVRDNEAAPAADDWAVPANARAARSVLVGQLVDA
jgi:hypothetical protein